MDTVLRNYLKERLFNFVRKVIQTDTFREEISSILDEQHYNRYLLSSITYRDCGTDYPELGVPESRGTMERNDVVFITARFRSGSTFLWNIFRNIQGCTAYYEPLLQEGPEERGLGRQHQIDSTHRGVEDYHAEFNRIRGLAEAHKSQWAFRQLKMDEFHFDPDLENYINLLIENAPGRPVLQFNRVDFRLQWLRSRYPNAKIMHLFRNPRDQWMSMVKNDGYISREFKWDKNNKTAFINTFYLWDWWKDLHFQMPFLKLDYLEHPYQVHYLVWRMSYLYGKQFSDLSLRYESVMLSFEQVMDECLKFLEIKGYDIKKLANLVNPRVGSGWQDYASDSWFRELESKAESLLASFFKPRDVTRLSEEFT